MNLSACLSLSLSPTSHTFPRQHSSTMSLIRLAAYVLWTRLCAHVCVCHRYTQAHKVWWFTWQNNLYNSSIIAELITCLDSIKPATDSSTVFFFFPSIPKGRETYRPAACVKPGPGCLRGNERSITSVESGKINSSRARRSMKCHYNNRLTQRRAILHFGLYGFYQMG